MFSAEQNRCEGDFRSVSKLKIKLWSNLRRIIFVLALIPLNTFGFHIISNIKNIQTNRFDQGNENIFRQRFSTQTRAFQKLSKELNSEDSFQQIEVQDEMVNMPVLQCLLFGFETENGDASLLQNCLEQDVFGQKVSWLKVLPEMMNDNIHEQLESQEQILKEFGDALPKKMQYHTGGMNQKMLVVLTSIDQDFIDYITQCIDQLDIGPIIVTSTEPTSIPADMIFQDLRTNLIYGYTKTYHLMEKNSVADLSVWNSSLLQVVLQAEIDGSMVSSKNDGQRWDTSKLIVLDNFIDECLQQQLLDLITEPQWDHKKGPPQSKWQKLISDIDSADEDFQTWGLSEEALHQLCQFQHPALIEVHTRLAQLYPEYHLTHLSPAVYGEHIAPMVANAPLPGEHFSWHIDADPSQVPPSPWSDLHGTYTNREPGKPLFVTLLMYLTGGDWDENWHAETLFLDNPTDTGILVRPKPGRIVLMDQDITHRICAPSSLSNRPRYSLVWKLVFHPKNNSSEEMTILKPKYGQILRFGSAQRIEKPSM